MRKSQDSQRNNFIIIPTYNEAENLMRLIPSIKTYSPESEIVIVDDSPNESTSSVARSLDCRILRRRGKKGLASAVIDGLTILPKLNDCNVIIMDADGQHPPKLLPQILKELDEHRVVVPSRYCNGGEIKGWSRFRTITSLIANLLALPLIPRVKDRTTGYMGFKSGLINGIKLDKDIGYKICLEILIKSGCKDIVEIPYTFGLREYGNSKFSRKQVLLYLKHLIKLYFHKFRILRFGIVGGLGVPTNLIILYLLTEFGGLAYWLSFAFAFLTAASQNYWLNKIWTFGDRTESRLGYLRYLLVSSATLILDEFLLITFTELVGIWYMVSAILAIAIAFITRYFVSGKWIWKRSY